MSKVWIFASLLIAAGVIGCDKPPPEAPQVRPVRTVVAQRSTAGETISLTGQVRAQNDVNLAFRLDGRVTERTVDVGAMVAAGQLIGRIDPQIQENELRAAQANLSAAQSTLTEARREYGRQKELLAKGFASVARFDQAQQAFDTAQAQVDSAQAQLRTAQERMGYTELRASAAGAVIAVGAWPGEVVTAGQMIVKVALQGGRDAVFDVPEQLIRTGPRDPSVQIELTNDPQVAATGRVREVAPQADPATRTYQVKVGIIDPPEAMRLGATVTGRLTLAAPPGFAVPASALTQSSGRPAVWVVDPQSQTVSLRDVDVVQYDPATVLISNGLDAGDVVVTAGVQTLRPAQKVRVLGGS
jgi:membrane fusion protein, multidrug efflux system